jgi:hypothetical protein
MCYEHILRMTTDRLPKILLNYELEDTKVSHGPQIDGRAYFVGVGTS